MRSAGRPDVRIRASSGELARADVMAGLRNRDGAAAAEAVRNNGKALPGGFTAALTSHQARSPSAQNGVLPQAARRGAVMSRTRHGRRPQTARFRLTRAAG